MKPEPISITVDLAGGKQIAFETGKLAKQAHGAAVVRLHDNVVLATAVANAEPREGIDFFPLTVDYREYTYAGGRIPGGFIKREGRPSEREILTSRQIDRPVRPLFPEGFRCETQVIAFVLSADTDNDPDVCGINAASCALTLSDIPFHGPIGAVRVGLVNGTFIVNPTYNEMRESLVNIMVVGTADGIVMIESGAKEVKEETVVDAIEFGHTEIKKICAAINDLRAKVGKSKRAVEPVVFDDAYYNDLRNRIGADLADRLDTKKHPKAESHTLVKELKKQLLAAIPATGKEKDDEAAQEKLKHYYEILRERIFREQVIEHKRRPDARAFDEVREIWIEAGILPRTHGSAIFTRGETQALVTTTLGTSDDMQRLEGFEGEAKKRFMLHYNFPPFSVGEVAFLRGAGRREIGHGALAERALSAVLPNEEKWPYAMRVVADILESNGSSSMATVCGASLSLMDAGVPLKAPVAGVAMGLVKEGEQYAILTDIAGAEDHYGDMDFKVAGTKDGITALQMDIKITGVTFDILRDALTQAHEARAVILGKMAEVIPAPREALSQYAPRIEKVQIDPSQIGLLIGKGGETIRGLCDEFESQIDVNDDGQVLIYSANGDLADALVERIRTMMKEVEVGDEYLGKVVKTTAFGAFIELSKGTDGLLHISNVSPGKRVDTVEEALNKGDEISVRVVEVDRERGRIGVRLADDPEIAGKTIDELAALAAAKSGGDRGPRRPREGGDSGRNGGTRGSGRPRHRD